MAQSQTSSSAAAASSSTIEATFLALRAAAKFRHTAFMHGGGEWPRATEIIADFLWLGDEDDADDAEWLDDLGITHVLNCAGKAERGNTCYRLYLELDAEDDPAYDLLAKHRAASLAFLGGAATQRAAGLGLEGIEDGDEDRPPRVLVHCVAGVNRSAAIVVAYLMQYGLCAAGIGGGREGEGGAGEGGGGEGGGGEGGGGEGKQSDPPSEALEVIDAIRHVLERRPICFTNDSFVRQLMDLAPT